MNPNDFTPEEREALIRNVEIRLESLEHLMRYYGELSMRAEAIECCDEFSLLEMALNKLKAGSANAK